MKLITLFFFSLMSFTTLAFRLDPMSAGIELKDGQTYFNFIIANETNQPLPVQITLYERGMKDNGEDDLKETEEITAFPDQIIIPAEQKRSVKVTWVGQTKNLKTEKAFRFVAEQLPLDMKKNKAEKSAGIKMLLKYIASFYVNPEGTESRVSCIRAEKINSDVKIECENTGSKHQILTFKNLDLEDGITKIEFDKAELKKVNGENILANTKRTILIPGKEGLSKLKNPIKVNFKLEQ